MKVKLISITNEPEKLICYCARVSNPQNQENKNIKKLLKYCIKKKHWSIFEQANMNIEITTTRGISPQILRHRSFNFQEFSQRYAKVSLNIPIPDLRLQDYKNRQNSIEMEDEKKKIYFQEKIKKHFNQSIEIYNEMIDKGIAKESARFILPLSTPTKLYMNGTIRNWIHYLQVRSDPSTQKEHREIANEIIKIFKEHLPIISDALNF